MSIYVAFNLPPTELSCIYGGELDEEQWKILKDGIADKSFYLEFRHRPTLFALYVRLKDVYEGSIDITEKSPGILVVSGVGKAKIDGTAKAVRQIDAENPTDMAFSGARAVTADFKVGGMDLASGEEEIDASVTVSAKKL